MTSPKWRHN